MWASENGRYVYINNALSKNPKITYYNSNTNWMPNFEVNDFNGEWKVLWRLSEQTGDVSGYFFKSNSEIDKRIQESCQVKSICIFKFQYDNLDYDQVKDKLPKDFPGASFYGEIKKIIDIKN